MKKIIVIVLACIFARTATSAQDNKITVVDFYLNETDITANMHGSIVYDQNGEKCALIKIRTNQEGFSFDVGALGIEKTIQKKGEIWVYVPHGVRKITLFHDKLATLEYNFNLTTQQAKTYILELQAKEIFDNVVDDNTKVGTLNLDIYPSTANVILNAIPVKLNEQGQEQVQLYYGRYTYKITDDNYYPIDGRIRINSNDAQTLKLRMKQAFGWLDINCPEGLDGAAIYVDDNLIDSTVTANRIPVRHGKHHLRIENPLYHPFSTEFSIKDSTITTLPINLQNNYGTVTLNAEDPLSTIFIDGIAKARGSWSGKVATGNHTFECRRGYHIPSTRILNIGNGSTITVPLEAPTPIIGTLDLSTNPDGASVYLNDTLIGTTPLVKPDVLIGNKHLRIEKEFYTTHERDIIINQDSTTTLAINLTNRVPVKITSNLDSAKVYLNAEYKGVAPYQDTLDGGRYALRLDAGKKYKAVDHFINITPSENEFHYILRKDHTRANELYFDVNYMLPTNKYAKNKPALGFSVGGYIHNVNFEVGIETEASNYSFTLNNIDYSYQGASIKDYINAICRIGYSITLSNRFRLTPQIGIQYNSPDADMYTYNPDDAWNQSHTGVKAFSVSATASCRIFFAFLPVMGISITPSYKAPIKESAFYEIASDLIPEVADSNSGFSIKAGLVFFIKL